ncbi:efflux transporter outer membrane subunit [Niveibacterium sp. SC-1]|uniref:efflux transporter outer membrane subunit n=1 Tax=Niveibacterium sp. SC-1 TaxID=3135646 RepID=UPI00311FCFFE
MRKPALLCALSLLAGCAVIHSETKPVAPAPSAWRADAPAAPPPEVFTQGFWQQFGDPVLNDLVQAAWVGNPDLRIAAARVQAYYAQVTVTGADRWPQADLAASAGRGKGGNYGARTSNLFSVGVELNWEIDLWGRLARTTDAARADLLAQEESQRGIYLSLAASVAQAYLQLRALDAQLLISQDTVRLRKQTLDLFQLRFEGGVISEVELAQAESEYDQALAAVPDIERSIAQTENALSQLLGRPPGTIPRGKDMASLAAPEVPPGLPSDLLARRPDIRAAEASLAAADARVDAARLEYFPRISLTGLFGFASTDASQLLESPARVWSGAAGLVQPLFEAGRIGANVDISHANREAAIAQYQGTVLAAFRETEDALVERRKRMEELAAKTRRVDAVMRYAELSRLRYENGYTSYLEVIDADRTLFSVQLDKLSTQGALLNSVVVLYRALGGDWMDAPIATAAQAQSEPR